MLRSPILLLLSGVFAGLLGVGGCQLATDGQDDGSTELDASGDPASSGVCNLTCARGSHCELGSEGPACEPNSSLEGDADASTSPPATTPATCDLACSAGSHCVVQPKGPSCVADPKDPDPVIPDAGKPVVVPDAGTPPTSCSLTCGSGRHCQLTAKGQACVLDDKVDAGSETPCGSETCAADEKCCSASCGICEPRGSACPAIACPVVDAEVPRQTCANTKCPPRTYCDDITGSAECKDLPSCDTVKCTATTTCELVEVQCVRAPCPPLPMCVPKEPQVCNLQCKPGAHCAFSANGPKCEPDEPGGGVSCGKKTCGGGQVCCNASCGICASPTGACPAIACAPTDKMTD